jgi:oligopeptidase B
MKTNFIPPAAKKIPVEIIKHGDLRIDNYVWLKDKSNPEVIEYLKKENDYAESVMGSTKQLREKIYNEVLSRIKEDDESVPYKWGDWLYYNRKEKGNNYLKYYRKKDKLTGELILDVNKIAEGLKYCSVKLLPSPDNKILAYIVDNTGDFCATIYFKNLDTGAPLNDHLEKAWVCAWSNDSNLVYYVKYEHGNRGKQVYKHKLGEKQDNDKLIYQEKDDKFWVHVIKSNSKKYIFISTGSFTTSEVYYLDADSTADELKLIQPRTEGVLYSVEHNNDEFYMLTNLDAPDYRVMKTSVGRTEKDYWKEFVPQSQGVRIDDFLMFRDFLVLAEMDFGLRKIRALNLKTGQSDYIAFPEPIYAVGLHDNFEFETNILRYYYTSFVTPVSYYDYDMEKGENILLKETEDRGGYNKNDYVSERIFAPTADGKNVPISLVYKKGMKKNGSNRLDLYAYGSYGLSMEVSFNPAGVSLLDRGFINATAHVRGGAELGEAWYKDGKLLNKKNTFNDFITCAEHLISEGYTYPGGIAAEGASAGGTLMGAVANMRPNLFKCIIANVPSVDLLNSLDDAGVDNSWVHMDELGDPNIEQQYFYMKSYSPYENIKEQHYPDMLITTGLNDANVRFWEPAKYTAKLRELKKGESTLILKTHLDSAHFGPSGRYRQFKEAAYQTAFILKSFGIGE